MPNKITFVGRRAVRCMFRRETRWDEIEGACDHEGKERMIMVPQEKLDYYRSQVFCPRVEYFTTARYWTADTDKFANFDSHEGHNAGPNRFKRKIVSISKTGLRVIVFFRFLMFVQMK